MYVIATKDKVTVNLKENKTKPSSSILIFVIHRFDVMNRKIIKFTPMFSSKGFFHTCRPCTHAFYLF